MARDIFTEPEEIDLDTLANLGPLAALAGRWEGQGVDTHRKVAPPTPNPALAAAQEGRG